MYTQFEAAEFLHGTFDYSYEYQFNAIEKLADEFETPGNRAWTQIVDEIIAWMQQGLPRKEVITWNLLGGKGYDTNKLAKQLTMIQNWVLKFHKGEVDVSPITITLEAFWEDLYDSKDVGFVVNDEYDENRNPIGEATYHKNKEEKEEKEWLSRIQGNARSQDNILRAIFNKAAGVENTTAGGAMVSKSIRRGQFWQYIVYKISKKMTIGDRKQVEKMVHNMYGKGTVHLSEVQFLNIMRGARDVIEGKEAMGRDSKNRLADTPYWYDFYETFVMSKVESQKILETFKAHDRNQSGFIELSELREDYEINKQIGGEAIKSMDRYDTDGDGKLDLKEFRYWHWDTNTLDQPSPEEIQERDRLVMLIKNLKDAFSTFTNDIEPELEDYTSVAVASEGLHLSENLLPAEGRINDGHGSYELEEGDIGFTRNNPFPSVIAACDVLFPFVEQCLKVIDEYNKNVSGKDKIKKKGLEFGWFWASPNGANYTKTARYDIITTRATSKSQTHKPGTIYPVAKRRGKKSKYGNFAFDSSPPFDDEGPSTPPQSPKRITIDTRDVIIEDSAAKRNKENIFKILMEKYKQATARLQQIESLKAEYSRLKDIAKEFIQGAEEDLA